MSVVHAYAKPHKSADGEVTFWIMPYRTTLEALAEGQLGTIKPDRGTWDHIDTAAVYIVSRTADITFAGNLSPKWLPLREFWTKRNQMPMEDRLQWIALILPLESMDEWALAWSNASNNPAPAPSELGQEKPTGDPLPKSDGEQSTATTSASSTRSSSKNLKQRQRQTPG